MTAKKPIPENLISVGTGDHVCYVYGLRFTNDGHEHSGRIRYVGKALDPWARFRKHRNPNEAHGKVQRSVQKNGPECYDMVILAKVFAGSVSDAEKMALTWETHFISHYQTLKGKHGLNQTLGGEGASLPESLRRKHHKARAENLNEIKKRPEVREKLARAGRERFKDPAYRAKLKATNATPEVRAKRARALHERYKDPQARVRVGETFRKLWRGEDFRARANERHEKMIRSEEFIAKASARFKAMSRDPDMKRKRAEGLRRYNNDEVRARKAEVARDLHQDAEFAKRYRDGLTKRYSDPANVESHARKTRDRHEGGALARATIIGIHLRWAKKHAADGKHDAAAGQVAKLRAVLEQCGDHPDEVRMKLLAQQFLEG